MLWAGWKQVSVCSGEGDLPTVAWPLPSSPQGKDREADQFPRSSEMEERTVQGSVLKESGVLQGRPRPSPGLGMSVGE